MHTVKESVDERFEHDSYGTDEINELCAKALENLSDGILIVDRDKKIIWANTALCHYYHVPKAALIHKSYDTLLENGNIEHSFADLTLSAAKSITYEQTAKNSDTFVCTTTPVTDPQKKVLFLIEQVRSVEELDFYSLSQKLAPALNPESRRVFHPVQPPLTEFKSPVMQSIYQLADNMAPKNINILILGSSGTGKTQLAKRIHDNSARRGGPFITINCSAIPDNLIESELFGYSKGAFSGASSQGKQGLVEAADNGTLFLDEIGELPLSLQAKLLQFVQEKTYIPIGSLHEKQVDTRIIAATNKEIPTLIRENKFREDLYYRLSAVTIHMPPLKGRPEDIRQLIRHFCSLFNLKHETNVAFSTDAVEILSRYTWPGNIREMEHLIEFLILSCQGSYITTDMLPSNITAEVQGEAALGGFGGSRFPDAAGSGAVPESGERLRPDAPSKSEQGTAGSLASGTGSHSGICFAGSSVSEAENEFHFCQDPNAVKSYAEFIRQQECRLVRALYPQFNTSYKLSQRLAISQSTASRLIRKYIKTGDND